uniref:DMSO reductase family type II enzyme, heme b subunit n=1 Tax=Candidatus Kentrum sp. LFY TaxID=2126342 RepID=A0A450UNX5_9GAMM|nr:MAG: DMSO reductase family type II enzyme, heme b subunit [Candidatus Kentron sp. LFY]
MKTLRIPAFWRAVLVVLAAWFLFDNAFPPVLPRSLMIQFMTITVVGVLLYFSFEEKRWIEFKAPILAVLRDRGKWPIRWSLLVAIPALAGYVTYGIVKPSFDAPVELRQVHPAPPSTLRVFDKSHDLGTLENPVRERILARLESDKPESKKTGAAMAAYGEIVEKGRDIYFKNCFYCHGDLLDGTGPFAQAFNPLPANFQDVGTIAQLQEAFLFWRITTGGPGLPKEGTPWNSAMPVWHEMLDEEAIWNVITFLYDYVGQVPRMWNPDTSKAVTGMKEQVQAARKAMDPAARYRFRCAACHGETGAGDGPAADFLYPRPRDFTLGLFKYKTSPGMLPPRDEDLFDTIEHGLEGTGMPGWATLLSDEQVQGLIPVIKGFDTMATWAPEDADDDAFDDEGRYLEGDFTVVTETEPLNGQIPYSEESIARGRTVFRKACKECHGDLGRGNITSGKRLADDWEARIWPRDLTKPWTWRITNVPGKDEAARLDTIARIYQRLSIGIPGTPMPAHRAVEAGNKDPVRLEDRWHIANYVYARRQGAAPMPGEDTLISALKIEGELPLEVDDPAWSRARAVTLRLAPNIIEEERLFTSLSDALTVRALYNDADIAFLLEAGDRTDSRPGEPVSEQIQDENLDRHSDAFAIQFPKNDAYVAAPVVEKPLFRHGDARHLTTIWYWNAGSVSPATPPQAVLLDASGSDRKLIARETSDDLTANGKWEHGRWRVVMKRSRNLPDAGSAGVGDEPGVGDEHGDISFDEGRFMPVSFANWDGSNGEAGSRHTLTTWYWLLLPPEADRVKMFGIPLGIGLLVFIAGIVLVRGQRHAKS